MTRIIVRCEASHGIGVGHLMRTVALAEQAKCQHVPVSYVTYDPVGRALLDRLGLTLLDTGPRAAVGKADESWLDDLLPDDVVVFDAPTLVEEMALACTSGARVAVIDDTGSASTVAADLILNQNPASATGYDVGPGTRLLLGPRYALVRREFRARRHRRAGGPGRLVLTFGGSDPNRVAPRVVSRLGNHRVFDQAVVVVGPATDYPGGILAERSWLQVVRPKQMAEIFDQADAAISAAGSTTWELLCMGVPTALIQVVNDQALVGPGAASAGAAVFLGPTERALEVLPAVLPELADEVRQGQLSEAAMDLVDGCGAGRVLEALLRP